MQEINKRGRTTVKRGDSLSISKNENVCLDISCN